MIGGSKICASILTEVLDDFYNTDRKNSGENKSKMIKGKMAGFRIFFF